MAPLRLFTLIPTLALACGGTQEADCTVILSGPLTAEGFAFDGETEFTWRQTTMPGPGLLQFEAVVPDGASLASVVAHVDVEQMHGGMPDLPSLRVRVWPLHGSGFTTLARVTDPSSSLEAYEKPHTISVDVVYAPAQGERLTVEIDGESGEDAMGFALEVRALDLECSYP